MLDHLISSGNLGNRHLGIDVAIMACPPSPYRPMKYSADQGGLVHVPPARPWRESIVAEPLEIHGSFGQRKSVGSIE